MDSCLVKQRGVATLTIALSLIIAISMLSYAVAYTANTEQRMTQNDQLRMDSLQAAEAGMLFGLQWLGSQRPEWIPAEDKLIATADTTPALPTTTHDSFALNIVFEAADENDRFIRISSEASAAHAPEISTRLSLYAKPISILTDIGERAPPLTLDGCLLGTTGKPRLLPDPDSADPISLVSSHPRSCLDESLINLGTGRTEPNAFADHRLWERLFAISREEFQNLADAEADAGLPDNERNYWVVETDDLSAGRWTRSLGSPEQPIILVVPQNLGCPEFGGGATIYGLVYIDGNCTGSSWGTIEIYGALAIGGNSSQLSDAVRITHISLSASEPPRILPPLIGAIPVPGTWSDL